VTRIESESPKIVTRVELTHLPTLHCTIIGLTLSDSSPLAYLRERSCELDIGAFLHCKEFEDLLRAHGLWYCESWGIGENEKVKADSTTERCFS